MFDWTKPAIEEDKSLPKQRKVTYLSFSQIDTFRTCPLQYRYRFLQKIPIPSSAAQSFGDSIHKTLRDFYQQIKEKREQSLKDLLDLLGKNWSNTGYISKAHEQKMRVKGEEMLKKFYGKIDLEVIPEDLEQPFVIKISPELKLGGKIDRVDKKNDKLKIIDYKTGKVLSQEEIDKSLQMTIYALAAIDKGVYGKNARDVVLTFYFLEEAEEKLTTRTSEQLEAAKQEIIKKAEEIEKSSFEPIPGPWCDFCDFKLICEAWL